MEQYPIRWWSSLEVGSKNTYMNRNFWVTYGHQLYFASPKIKAPNYMKNYDAYAM